MYEPVIACAGLAVLFLLCLPLVGIHKLILELSAWILRLSLLALLGAAAYLWVNPGQLPPEVPEALSRFPWLQPYLPDPATPYFSAVIVAAGGAGPLPAPAGRRGPAPPPRP